jgi:hypothetical protein
MIFKIFKSDEQSLRSGRKRRTVEEANEMVPRTSLLVLGKCGQTNSLVARALNEIEVAVAKELEQHRDNSVAKVQPGLHQEVEQ